VVSPANINGPGQVVIAGHATAVDRAIDGCKARGAKRAIKLAVSAPFHCALMKPAQDRLAEDLGRLTFRDPAVPLVNNVDAKAVTAADECRTGLVRQVSGAVRWQESVERLAALGVTIVVEIGPGTVLCGLVRKIAKDVRVLNVEDPASLEKAVGALRAN
jgi:[acyl-carrier-protein] S-malonyltransferase